MTHSELNCDSSFNCPGVCFGDDDLGMRTGFLPLSGGLIFVATPHRGDEDVVHAAHQLALFTLLPLTGAMRT